MIIEQFWIYIVLALTSLINIIIPIYGSATVTPFLAVLTDPHTAIALASFYFFLGALVRAFLFRKEIKWSYIKNLLPLSFIGAIIGAFALIKISPIVLLITIFIFSAYFFYKKIRTLKVYKEKSSHKLTVHSIGLLSGFLQGTGLAGSDLRNSYLYSEKLTLPQVHGTTALIGAINFFIATVIRLITNQVTIPNLIPLLYVFPFIVFGSWIGKKILYKINKQFSDWLIILIMTLILLFLTFKIVALI